MDNIRVAVRIRPLNTREKDSGHEVSWAFNGESLCPFDDKGRPDMCHGYTFGARGWSLVTLGKLLFLFEVGKAEWSNTENTNFSPL
jgi:hypothetical protein